MTKLYSPEEVKRINKEFHEKIESMDKTSQDYMDAMFLILDLVEKQEEWLEKVKEHEAGIGEFKLFGIFKSGQE